MNNIVGQLLAEQDAELAKTINNVDGVENNIQTPSK